MAMPWVPGPIIMFYNRNLMEQAGLDPDAPPQTWPELMEAAKAICALPDVDGAPIYGIALRTAPQPQLGPVDHPDHLRPWRRRGRRRGQRHLQHARGGGGL